MLLHASYSSLVASCLRAEHEFASEVGEVGRVGKERDVEAVVGSKAANEPLYRFDLHDAVNLQLEAQEEHF